MNPGQEYDHLPALVPSDAGKHVIRRLHVREYDVSSSGNDGDGERSSLTFLGERRSAQFIFLVIAIFITALSVRLLTLQATHGSEYRQRADRNRIRTQVIPAPRGSIIDRNGKPLVNNIPNFVLAITPADLPTRSAERAIALQQISNSIHLPVQQIEDQLQHSKRSLAEAVPIVDHASYDQALEWIVQTNNLAAVTVEAVPTRQYPYGPALAPILGYIGKISEAELAENPKATMLDYTGKTGLEHQYNSYLQGRDGTREVEHDVFNREQTPLRRQQPEPGQTLQLSIDIDLQQHLYDALYAQVQRLHAPGGAATIVDPQSGEVLAMVSVPTYDNNWFLDSSQSANVTKALTDPQKLLLNRAIGGIYPSGSIIKPIIGTAAMAEHIITPHTTVLSVGGFKIGVSSFPDWKAGGHGVTNLAKALAESVNTFFYAVGGGYQDQAGLGVERIVKYLQLFGWGSKLGIDIPGEASGFVPTKTWREKQRPSPWKLGDTYHLSIGQGDLEVTPLQIAMSIATVANGGTLYTPQLVRSIQDPNGQTIKTLEPNVIRKSVAPADAISAVQFGMRQGVLDGSSRQLQSLPVASAGKTGTAQFGREGKTHAWYAAYAPYDHPTVAMAVIVEAGGEGNAAALPVAKEVLQWYFSRPPVTP